MKYQFYAIIYDVAGNTTPIGNSASPAKSFVTNIQKVTGISISPSGSITKNIGENFTISATITPSDANNKTVNWNSTNTSVATVDSNGKVTCLSAGSTTITATAADGSGVSASLTLTVRNPVNSLSLSQSSITIAKDGFTANITLTIDPSDYADSNISWTISNTSIATLSGTGKTRTITATSTIGDTTLTVSAGDKTATCAIHVVAFTSQTFSYTGKVQSIDLPAGKYKLECWGAQGGKGNYGDNFSLGGYSVGIMNLKESKTLYVVVGSAGAKNTGANNNSESVFASGGYNGGGNGMGVGGGGGGATHIGLINSLLTEYSSVYASKLFLVAGGGGGDGSSGGAYNCAYGGGTSGGTTSCGGNGTSGGGSQSSGGSGGVPGHFGQGGSATFTIGGSGDRDCGGGGGGFYGGGCSNGGGHGCGGGGSGYVNTSILTSAQTIAGNLSFPNVAGTGNEIGHTGNGAAKITLVN